MHLSQFFRLTVARIDERGQGQITFTDFEKLFEDDAVKAFFESLQIGAVDAWTLFQSLDMDGDHTISVDEFTERCLQLHGPARSADLYALRQSSAKLGKQLQAIERAQQRLDIQLLRFLAMVDSGDVPKLVQEALQTSHHEMLSCRVRGKRILARLDTRLRDFEDMLRLRLARAETDIPYTIRMTGSSEKLDKYQRQRSSAQSNESELGLEGLDSHDLAVLTHNRLVEAFESKAKAKVEAPDPAGTKQPVGWQRCQDFSRRVVNSSFSNAFFALVVLSNSVYLGVQLEYYAQVRNPADSAYSIFLTVHLVYAVLFTAEVCLRLAAEGLVSYLWSSEWHWNWLDVFVVSSSWIELMIDIVTPGTGGRGTNSNLRLMRLLRIGRLFRVVRIMKVVRLFRSLRTLVQSLVGTLKSLAWAMVLLSLIMYIFAILFTDAALDYIIELKDQVEPLTVDEENHLADVSRYFGSLYRSFITMYQVISDGLTWSSPAHALYQLPALGPYLWVQLFHFYIAFVAFAVLNVMTGIGAVDAWTLFVSLDMDGDHTVSVEDYVEFTERCMQLHGPARSADLFALRQTTVKLSQQVQQLQDAQKQSHRLVSKSVGKLGHDSRPEPFSV
eukprot:s1558_g15.t1